MPRAYRRRVVEVSAGAVADASGASVAGSSLQVAAARVRLSRNPPSSNDSSSRRGAWTKATVIVRAERSWSATPGGDCTDARVSPAGATTRHDSVCIGDASSVRHRTCTESGFAGVDGTKARGSTSCTITGLPAVQVSTMRGRAAVCPGSTLNAPSRLSVNIGAPADVRSSSFTTQAVRAGTALRSFSTRHPQRRRQTRTCLDIARFGIMARERPAAAEAPKR